MAATDVPETALGLGGRGNPLLPGGGASTGAPVILRLLGDLETGGLMTIGSYEDQVQVQESQCQAASVVFNA